MTLVTKDRARTLAQEAKRLAGLTQPGMHRVADGPGLHGLYLQIAGPSSRSWIYRYKRAGKQRDLGLGSAFLVSLQDAAQAADTARLIHSQGGDPVEQRQAERLAKRLANARGVTFREVAEQYITQHSPAWKNAKHASQWRSTLATYVYPAVGSLPIQAVDVALILDIIRPMWLEKTETASRVRGRIEAIIDYATPMYRTGDNPARWQILKSKLPRREKIAKVKHHAALAYLDMPGFMTELRGHDSTGARCLEFVALTAVRLGEVIEATWTEIDFDAGTWTIPPERMKADNEHRVPLSDRAVEILRDMQNRREGDFIFPGAGDNRPVSGAALYKMLATLNRPVTVHGFRSTFRDRAGADQLPARARREGARPHGR
jgi:integrase